MSDAKNESESEESFDIDDEVFFTKPGYPLTGKRGIVHAVRDYAVTVSFITMTSVKGLISYRVAESTWPRHYLGHHRSEPPPSLSCGAV
jgi:hypothetical protein